MTEHEQVMADALSKLQRKVKRVPGSLPALWLCTECGCKWQTDAETGAHFPTCATGIARAARVACGLEPC